MKKRLYMGVDGGATKCTIRLEDECGELVGQTMAGPANIRLSIEQAWQSILTGLSQLHIDANAVEIHAGMGMAGYEIVEAVQAFIHYPHPFATLHVTSDAHAACVGAHGGEDGAIIIIGTGTVGFQCEHGKTTKVGGWGFPHDDMGGGAWLGLEAVKMTLQALDGRLAMSPLTNAVYNYFNADDDALVAWANTANSTRFAELAPLVIRASETGDIAAITLLQSAAREVEKLARALHAKQIRPGLPCVLIGGVAPYIEAYLSEGLRATLRSAITSPEAGAIMLIRHAMVSKQHA